MSLFTLGARLTADAKRLSATIKIPRSEAIREIRLLAAHALGLTHSQLIVRERESPGRFDLSPYGIVFDRRLKGEPIAYIVGECGFHEHTFRVFPSVLIPRPETELLVEAALQVLQDFDKPRVLDLGTGSGCIGISIGLACDDASVLATDKSPAAVSVAQENALLLNARNVEVRQSDWYSDLSGVQFDAIVSNPPYVAENDVHLAALGFEPTEALVSGYDGLDALRVVIARAPDHLAAGGLLAVEHGFDQQGKVREMFENAGFQDVQTLSDLAGKPRLVTGKWRAPAKPGRRRKAAASV